MSRTLRNNEVEQFSSEVKQAYQAEGVMKPLVRKKVNVQGSMQRFQRFGTGMAMPRIPQTDVTPMNVDQDYMDIKLEDWYAAEYTDIFDQARVNYSERAELATLIAKAIGRREDQIIIDALSDCAAAPWTSAQSGRGLFNDYPTKGLPGRTATGAKVIASGLTEPRKDGTATGANELKGKQKNQSTGAVTEDVDFGATLQIGHLIALAQEMDERNLPGTDRNIIWTPRVRSELLLDEKVQNADYANVKALIRGEIDSFMGFKFHMIKPRKEGGLKKNGAGDRDLCIAFHGGTYGGAVYASGLGPKTSVDWIPEKTSWLSMAMFAAGAGVIDPVSIIKFYA